MIAKDKEVPAMKALQAVIIRGRAMAYEKADHSKLADLLDRAEYLAALIYGPQDMTETFRANHTIFTNLAQIDLCNRFRQPG